ncbi:unnamed protein product [Nippostrongylus brasiliensis]|uniref:Secreted protein n=1 Tax=Nippostrongylus brasiliensis TaxID=27835 RepID=A0A0N4YWV5_NIPBR|nr:unnamed protein product [Nippostrongylus brasiliensis]
MQQLSATMQLVLPRLQYLQTTSDILMERTSVLLSRTSPKSNCIFCTVEENRDSHYSGRCIREIAAKQQETSPLAAAAVFTIITATPVNYFTATSTIE